MTFRPIPDGRRAGRAARAGSGGRAGSSGGAGGAARAARARTAALVPVLGAVLALSGCSTAAAGSGQTGADDGAVAGTVIAVADRQPAPSMAGRDLDGKPLALSGFAGKVVVLNVWGSWCGPCRAEADDLAQVAGETAGQGVQFVGLDVKDLQADAPRAFVREHRIAYPNLYDPQGMTLLAVPPNVLNAQAIPSTLVIDRSGRIAARALQPVTAQQLHRMLDPVVGEAP